MIEIAGFPVTIEPQGACREAVYLGVVVIGSMAPAGQGGWCWSIELPLVRQLRRARSREEAVLGIERVIRDWIEAARRRPGAAQVRSAAR